MPNEWFLVYLLIATLYGYVMYKMGQNNASLALTHALVDCDIIKSQEDMQEKIYAHYEKKEQEDNQ